VVSCLSDFFFFIIFFFFFLVSWLLDVKLSPGEGGEEEEETGEEGVGSTLESTCRGSNEGDGGTGVMTLGTTEVENNHMGKPMVNPGKDNVAIYGALTFLNEGNGLGFPSGGKPWTVDSGNVAIKNEPEKHSYHNQECELLPGIFRGQ